MTYRLYRWCLRQESCLAKVRYTQAGVILSRLLLRLIYSKRTVPVAPWFDRYAQYFSDNYIDSIEYWSDKISLSLIESRPSAILFRESHDRLPKGYYPRWPLGDIWLLIKNYSELYSGNGIKHYLRCDYSLNLEPYHSFILSDLHRGEYINEVIIERIHECDLHDVFRTKIDEILTTSPLLPAIFRDKTSSIDQSKRSHLFSSDILFKS